METQNTEIFVKSYINTALWSSTDHNDNPLDNGGYELSEEAKKEMRADCIKFLEVANKYINNAYDSAGHDFWLTRNGHGAGFWDSGRDKVYGKGNSDKLNELSQKFKEVDLYVGDDNLIYQS